MPLRVLNVVTAPEGQKRFVTPQGVTLSTSPCSECPSRCCQMRIVVSTIDAVRLARPLRLPVAFSVEVKPWNATDGLVYAWPFKLDEGGRFVLHLRRERGYCTHLVRPGQPTSRCGVYAIRPSICRLYPFVVEDHGETLGFGSQNHCPVQWLADDAVRAGLERDVAAWREDRALDLEVVRFWNRGRRARTRERLFSFLEQEVARELGLR